MKTASLERWRDNSTSRTFHLILHGPEIFNLESSFTVFAFFHQFLLNIVKRGILYFISDIFQITGISVCKLVGSKILQRSIDVFRINNAVDSFNPLKVEFILQLLTKILHPLADSYRVSDSQFSASFLVSGIL